MSEVAERSVAGRRAKVVMLAAIAAFAPGLILVAASGIELTSYADLPHGPGLTRYLPPWTWPAMTIGVSLVNAGTLLALVARRYQRRTRPPGHQ